MKLYAIMNLSPFLSTPVNFNSILFIKHFQQWDIVSKQLYRKNLIIWCSWNWNLWRSQCFIKIYWNTLCVLSGFSRSSWFSWVPWSSRSFRCSGRTRADWICWITRTTSKLFWFCSYFVSNYIFVIDCDGAESFRVWKEVLENRANKAKTAPR